MATKTIFPSFLTSEIAPETARNLARFEQLHQTSYARIANAANQAGHRIAQQTLSPSKAGVAASRAASSAQAQAATAMARTSREASNAARSIHTQNRALAETSTVARAAAGALNQTATGLQVVQGPLGPLAGRLTAASNALKTLTASAFAFATSGAGIFAAGAVAQGYADVRSQLAPLFEGQTELNKAMADTARIARDARQSLQPVGDLYQRLTLSGREFGIEQARIARVTETIAKAARLSGGTSQAQEAGIGQLSQALGSGTFQGDELRSVRENTLRLYKAIADGLDVPIGKLKEMGAEGKLTTEVIIQALERSASTIDSEFGRMDVTLRSAFTAAGTSATVFFGRIDQGLKVTERFANVILAVSDNLHVLGAVLGGAAVLALAKLGGNFISGLQAAKSFGVAVQGIGTQAVETAAVQVRSTQAATDALRLQTVQIGRNIAAIEAQRAAAVRALNASKASATAGFGRIAGGPAPADAQRGVNASTKELIKARRELRQANAALAASEAALAAAQGRATQTMQAFGKSMSFPRAALNSLKAAGSGLVAFLGGPWGVAFTAASALLVINATRMDAVERAAKRLGLSEDELKARLAGVSTEIIKQNEALRENARLKAKDDVRGAFKDVDSARERVARAVRDAGSRGPFGLAGAESQFIDLAARIARGEVQTAEILSRLRMLPSNNAERVNEKLPNVVKAVAELTLIEEGATAARKAADELDASLDFAANVGTGKIKGGRTSGKNLKGKGFAGGAADISVAELNAMAKAEAAGADEVRQAQAALTETRAAAKRELDAGSIKQAEYVSRVAEAERRLISAREAEKARKDAVRDAAKATRDATTAEDKRLRALEQTADLQRRIADITGRYEDQPNNIQRALRDIRALGDIVNTRLADGTEFDFSAGDAARESAKIVAGLRRDMAENVEDKEHELEIDRMILQGREREAAILDAKRAFQREVGSAAQFEAQAVRAIAEGRFADAEALRQIIPLLAEYESRTTAAAAASVDQARAKESAQRLISIYEAVPQSLQQGFESVFENIHRRGVKSAKDLFNVFRDTFRRFQAQLIGEYLFGGLDRQIGDLARPGSATGTRESVPAGSRAAPASLLTQVGTLFGLGSSSANKELVGVTEENSEKLEALGNTLTRSTRAEERTAAKIAGSLGAAAGAIFATGKTLTNAANAAASAAAGTSSGKARSGNAVDAMNETGKVLGGKLDKLFGTTAKEAGKSGAIEGLGANAGTALAAYTAADTITDLLGIKGVAGGAIKGAATGFALGGPVGAGVGAIIGGLTSALKKTAKSSATISSSGGSFGDATITGSSSKRKAAAGSLGSALEDAISGVVDQLDATLGDVKLSIGTRKKKFVLDPSGRGRTKGSGVQKFDTEEEAIEAGLRLALQRGVVKGITAASQRILQSGQDLEDAIEKASLIESVPKRLLQLTDPARYAVEELNKQFGKLIDALIEGGATAEQIADAEKLYGLERAAAVEAAQQSVSDSIDRFLSDIRAGSASPLGAKATYANADKELQGFRTDIAAGKAVDDDKLVEALQTFYDASRALNGSRAAFFEDYADIQSLAEKARAINRNAVGTAPDTSTLPASPFESGDRAAKIDAYLQKQNQISTAGNDILAGLPDAIADRLAALLGGRAGTSRTAFDYLPGLGGLGFSW